MYFVLDQCSTNYFNVFGADVHTHTYMYVYIQAELENLCTATTTSSSVFWWPVCERVEPVFHPVVCVAPGVFLSGVMGLVAVLVKMVVVCNRCHVLVASFLFPADNVRW